MRLFNFPSPVAKRSVDQFFFALIVTDHKLQSILWRVSDGHRGNNNHGSNSSNNSSDSNSGNGEGSGVFVEASSTTHDWYDEESFLNATDRSFQELGPQAEHVKYVLFALEHDWVTHQGIARERKPLLLSLTKQLGLDPLGFVVTAEAVMQYFAQLSHPLNCVLVELSEESITLTVVVHSKITQVQQVGRSGEIISDLIEAFAHIEHKPFPEKLMIFSLSVDVADLDVLAQEIMAQEWQEEGLFLHPPVVDVLTREDVHQAIVQTGGRAGAESLGLMVQKEEEGSRLSVEAHSPLSISTSLPSLSMPSSAFSSTSSFTDRPAAAEHRSAVEHHFATSSHPSAFTHPPTFSQPPPFNRFSFATPTPRTRKIFAIIIGIILGSIVAVSTLWIYVTRSVQAVIVVKSDATALERTFTLLVDTRSNSHAVQANPSSTSSTQANSNQVNAAQTPTSFAMEEVSVEVSDQQSLPTSQIKKGGEKAKGSIKLYNFTNSEKTFSSNTPMRVGNLTFLLQGAVTVPAATTKQETSISPKQIAPSTAKGLVVAAAPGEASNLEKDKELIVDHFAKDTYVAVSEGLSGGTSRDIPVVSTNDQEKLRTTLKKQLISQAQTKLLSQADQGTANKDTIVMPLTTLETLKATFSANVGDEAQTLNLEMTVKAHAVKFSQKQLREKVLALLQSEVPSGFHIQQSALVLHIPSALSSVPSAQGASSIQGTPHGPNAPSVANTPNVSSGPASYVGTLPVRVQAVLQPDIPTEEYQTLVHGLPATAAEELLRTKPHIKAVEVKFSSPAYQKIWPYLPDDPRRIFIHVQ